ncbi:MAG: hypothetical protein IT320_04445 [Anaerolineae bacterium]|nr:hypothetical protein [Anaerolineae bacterium]
MPDTETQLGAAAELIRSREYDKARALLKTIDHPKAREWLQRLGENAPESPAKKKLSAAGSTYTPDTKTQLEIAANLIRSREFDEARTLLKAIDHSKAREWLQRLDEIAPEPPKKEPSTTQTLRGCFLFFLLVLGLCCALPNFSGLGGSTSRPQSGNRAIQPSSVEITDPRDTGIPERFLERLRQTVSSDGYVDFYEGQMSSEGRLLVDTEIWLTSRNPTSGTAYRVIEEILRAYATGNSSGAAGRISARVYWELNGLMCAAGVGMGYRTQQRIDWQSASRVAIFSALDQERYSDNTSSYADVAWRPFISGMPDCRD